MSGNDSARRGVFCACERLTGARRLPGMVLLQHDSKFCI
jgi:hypothetical protein